MNTAFRMSDSLNVTSVLESVKIDRRAKTLRSYFYGDNMTQYKMLRVEESLLYDLKLLKGVYKVNNMSQVIREMMRRLGYNEEFFARIEGMVE